MAKGQLATGMTVQPGKTGGLMTRRAHCVICGWDSADMDYAEALSIATREGSHECAGPRGNVKVKERKVDPVLFVEKGEDEEGPFTRYNGPYLSGGPITLRGPSKVTFDVVVLNPGHDPSTVGIKSECLHVFPDEWDYSATQSGHKDCTICGHRIYD